MSSPEAASHSFAVLLRARRQDPSAIRTKRCTRKDIILMVKGGDELARGRIPELGGFVRGSPSGSEHRLG